ncbi:recombinase family protein [Gemella sp. zg-570]|uniref:recombinase family protein n=1 Tax=Gemella sp. zg-570 TaxID=2840371 RepID=UPI001C0C775E|nr:recombinase family protein [Gemella sp. zg-570]QWQ39164.1 recombinase family protein [Gemella sp. zg-570]
MYGYRFKNTKYEVERKEAKIIKQIYDWYIEGLSPTMISRKLNDIGETTRKGNKFSRAIIHNILSQETYTVKLILQKTYHDIEKGCSVINKGKRTMYIVENAQEAIITQEIFDRVQKEKSNRSLHNIKEKKSE